ncbi:MULTISPECIES: glucans biosynthesis glucosyltransferase MdoH [unclassified Ruegeria]|uniref:glucans biosynthesis glucosyltransferase MdoH n=1 Tax=unclassified Ruegeria TaxID=2625375 RepID=UPI00149169D1|nr:MULTISPECIES: glucans biosynthesis glucosyltransferase MdoH [unclassified Ruegeria]NOD87929.1 glucans biosynthesis glucosyltransferase MdoH [Ruegeria sp. HKCCD4318]NOE14299.1 glucans biosynthesis glucosyltransferase MdoH [Ruegeria sp. HKCCD4318-2]NOG08344.1 glucans biosynthesis glucosyltransferase MdoH [Ruegeria sp. HKCCD4315]
MSRDLHIMPPEAPLAMPAQNFGARFRDADAPSGKRGSSAGFWRALAFSPAMAATLGLLWVMSDWFSAEGINLIEAILLALISFNFFWISFTVCTVLLGMLSLSRQDRPQKSHSAQPLRVALLTPVYNEVPWNVLGNARTMLEDLQTRGGQHHYAMFILSDTRDPEIAAQEQASVEALRTTLAPGLELYYRRRDQNTDRKVGNIADWVSRWGADWDAMLVLDADSLMTGRAIYRLTDALARDPSAGLIQSYPQLIGAQSVFARMQQFANGVYGIAFAEGLARWCGQEGNYWGHNAIIRTKAFATSAGLPKLRSFSGQDKLIMSHDFVEAGLLRRAGWAVRFLPRIRGSYEETPPTLIDHAMRDRRWCQGNLQHLKLLGSTGFRAVSRFHMFHGAVGYLMSPLWFALLLMWALIGQGQDASVLHYFSPDNPLFPQWPEMSETRHVLIILVMYAMLLAPKVLGVLALPLSGVRYSDFGGARKFLTSFLAEVLLSILYAPILMVQQMIAVFRTAFGIQRGWSPQARDGGSYGLGTLVLCHALETISGIALSVGILSGLVSIWLAPIAISLALAIPLSALSGVSAGAARRMVGMREDFSEPAITRSARRYRDELKRLVEGKGSMTPAE